MKADRATWDDSMKAKGYVPDGKGGYFKPKKPKPLDLITEIARNPKHLFRVQKPKPIEKFDALWKAIGGPELVAEHRFHKTRRWRFDRAHLQSRIGIEVNGGVFSGGRHTRGVGYTRDREKINAAILENWRVFELTPEMITPETLKQILFLIPTA